MRRYDSYDDDQDSYQVEPAPSRRWLAPFVAAIVLLTLIGGIAIGTHLARTESSKSAEAEARQAAIAAQQAELAARQADLVALGANKRGNRADK